MNRERPNPTSADPASNEPAAARVERCTCCSAGREPDPTDDNMRATRRLRDLALAVAEKLAGQIVDEEVRQPAAQAAVPEDIPDAPGDKSKPPGQLSAMVLGFQRVERAVRQCILLSTKLHQDRLAWETQAEAMAAKVERERRERRKKHVERLVKEAIEHGSENLDEEFERREKLEARLDEEDIESDLGIIADSALVDRLCKDCGVEAPWDFWEDEHWALEEARHEPPGSVFAGARRSAAPEAEPDAAEPVEAEPPEAAVLQAEAEAPAVSAPEPAEPEMPEPEPPKPEPDNSFEAQMKARLVVALRSGAWVMALQMDPRLASYVYSRLNDSS